MKDKQSFVCVFWNNNEKIRSLKVFIRDSMTRKTLKIRKTLFYVTWGFRIIKDFCGFEKLFDAFSPSGLYGLCCFTADSQKPLRRFFLSAELVNAENSGNWFSIPQTCEFSLNFVLFIFIETRKSFCVFSSTTNHQTKLPYNLYINNANNKNHQQQHHQNVQNERKIDDHLAFNHDHYQLNGINRRQRFKRAANNLFEDNELLANYESSQNDGNNHK